MATSTATNRTPLARARQAAFTLTVVMVTASVFVGMSPSKATVGVLEDSSYTPIQPGAPMRIYPGPEYPAAVAASPFGVCTMNFVFKGREPATHGGRRRNVERTYIGGSGHCVRSVGQRVSTPDGLEFGTVAFRLSCRLTPCEGRSEFDDFALIRVDADHLHLVSPVMRGLGKPPTGFTTSSQTSAGDELLLHGQGPPYTLAEPGRTQSGLLDHDDEVGFGTTHQGRSHSGSPVVRLRDGKALGVIGTPTDPAALGGTVAAGTLLGGPTIEHVLVLLTEAEFDVELVTS